MKKILLIADARGWIFERHCNELKKRITEYDFDIVFTWHDRPPYDYTRYDLVYQLDPMGIPNLDPPREKTILGLRNEFMYRHDHNGVYAFYASTFHTRCCMFHVVNKNQYKDFSQVAKIPLLLVQHGVDTDIFKRGDKKESSGPLVVGTSGNAQSTGQKGFDLVEKACQISGCVLRTARQNLAQGHYTKEQMAQYYNEIDVYCNMSQTEGLNNCIMEAGATGVPTVCTDVGAVREMIDDGKSGFIIPRTAEDLAKKLIYFRDNRKAISEMGDSFMQTIRLNWSWNTKIEEYRKMFQAFFQSHP